MHTLTTPVPFFAHHEQQGVQLDTGREDAGFLVCDVNNGPDSPRSLQFCVRPCLPLNHFLGAPVYNYVRHPAIELLYP